MSGHGFRLLSKDHNPLSVPLPVLNRSHLIFICPTMNPRRHANTSFTMPDAPCCLTRSVPPRDLQKNESMIFADPCYKILTPRPASPLFPAWRAFCCRFFWALTTCGGLFGVFGTDYFCEKKIKEPRQHGVALRLRVRVPAAGEVPRVQGSRRHPSQRPGVSGVGRCWLLCFFVSSC